MKNRTPILSIGWLALLMFAACAPVSAPTPTPVVVDTPVPPVSPSETPFQAVLESSPTIEQPQATVEAPTEVPQPVATSRGPDLHSTNPSTVSLASGELQLVEFFRYT